MSETLTPASQYIADQYFWSSTVCSVQGVFCILQKTNGPTLLQDASSLPETDSLLFLVIRAGAAHIVPEMALSSCARPVLAKAADTSTRHFNLLFLHSERITGSGIVEDPGELTIIFSGAGLPFRGLAGGELECKVLPDRSSRPKARRNRTLRRNL